MSPTSDDPQPGDPKPPASGVKVRAKARTGNPKVRSEVADALGGLERSLSDVSTWAQLQAPMTDGGAAEPEADEVDEELGAWSEDDDEVIPVALPSHIPPPPGAAVGAAAGAAPLLSRFAEPDEVEDAIEAGTVLTSAVDVPQGVTQAEEDAEEARRRRRNGRVLSWSGVILLVAVAALWFVPDRSDDQDGTDGTEQTTTTDPGLLLDPADLTTTTSTTAAPVTVPPVVPEVTTPTTARRSTTPTTRRPTTPTTAAPVATTTLPPLQNPGCVGESCRTTRTVPPGPTTTTTAPPVTTPTVPLPAP